MQQSTFPHLLYGMMNVETHQVYSFMSNAIAKIIEECKNKFEGFDDEGQASKTSLQVAHNLYHKQGLFKGAIWMKGSKFCEVLDLLPMVGPAPTVVGSFLTGMKFEDNTLPNLVGFLKKRMENKDSILNLMSPTRRVREEIKKKIGELQGETAAAAESSCLSCNERKRKAAARRPQFEAANLRSNNENYLEEKGHDLQIGSFFPLNRELIFLLEF
ncbi:hypothetical protein M9H77_30628 [Catharanthus roseus]|uniref:Uncharacterized protein n=1 Tax=Catharanthus roseus TaxID=4058 RepID=A0ACB9ZY63_CATRO|nr:hypothetical protein M9H77_30628 [Catharanthus roseus]